MGSLISFDALTMFGKLLSLLKWIAGGLGMNESGGDVTMTCGLYVFVRCSVSAGGLRRCLGKEVAVFGTICPRWALVGNCAPDNQQCNGKMPTSDPALCR